MFIVDSLVLNSDRHLGNFGLIINESGCIVREAQYSTMGTVFSAINRLKTYSTVHF